MSVNVITAALETRALPVDLDSVLAQAQNALVSERSTGATHRVGENKEARDRKAVSIALRDVENRCALSRGEIPLGIGVAGSVSATGFRRGQHLSGPDPRQGQMEILGNPAGNASRISWPNRTHSAISQGVATGSNANAWKIVPAVSGDSLSTQPSGHCAIE